MNPDVMVAELSGEVERLRRKLAAEQQRVGVQRARAELWKARALRRPSRNTNGPDGKTLDALSAVGAEGGAV